MDGKEDERKVVRRRRLLLESDVERQGMEEGEQQKQKRIMEGIVDCIRRRNGRKATPIKGRRR